MNRISNNIKDTNSKSDFEKRVSLWVTALFIPLIFFTCEKEVEKPSTNNKVHLTLNTYSNPDYFTINVSGSLSQTNGKTFTDHGFCYAITPNPDLNSMVKSLGELTEQGNFTADLINLVENKKYYIRAYATFSGGTFYSEQKEITTLKTGKPLINTSILSDIKLTSAVCGGSIESDSGYTAITSGICWDIDNQFNEYQCLGKAVNDTGNSEFSLNISGLSESTTYFVKAYATNQNGTGYGEIRQFTTATAAIPTVITDAVTNLSFNSAICGGNVTNDGFAMVTARGVCWNTTENPTLQNCTSYTTDGQGIGNFTSTISNLDNSTYFVRAYATNIQGTAYGNQQNFTLPWSCETVLGITHTVGNIAPITKKVFYGTEYINLTGSNKCWITQNLGADSQATSAIDNTEASAGWYWQFNNKRGYMHDGDIRIPSTTWISSISEFSDWLQNNDPCTQLLGSGWRLPTKTEWETADATGGWDNYNETFSSVLKLHAAGFLYSSDGSLVNRGSSCYTWSSTQAGLGDGWNLHFNIDASSMSNNAKASGLSVRCLME